MAYEVVMPYHLHMPSYFLETFTEYPKANCFRASKPRPYFFSTIDVNGCLFPFISFKNALAEPKFR